MSDDQCTPGMWTHPSFDPSKLQTTDKPPVGGTPPFDPDPTLLNTVEVLRSAHHPANHKCQLPEHGKFEIGTLVRCVSCGKRYEMKRVPSQRVGGGIKAGYVGWVRRYWPWPR